MSEILPGGYFGSLRDKCYSPFPGPVSTGMPWQNWMEDRGLKIEDRERLSQEFPARHPT
jgi:hypothetical protein